MILFWGLENFELEDPHIARVPRPVLDDNLRRGVDGARGSAAFQVGPELDGPIEGFALGLREDEVIQGGK